jgi:hypothetical protein
MTILVWSVAVIGILSWTFKGNLKDGDYQKISKKNQTYEVQIKALPAR